MLDYETNKLVSDMPSLEIAKISTMLRASGQRGQGLIVSDTTKVPNDLERVAEMSSATIDVPAQPGKDTIG